MANAYITNFHLVDAPTSESHAVQIVGSSDPISLQDASLQYVEHLFSLFIAK